ncbi:MAG: hypothetical protein MJ191_02425 [Clostridium sp.]|nr:hypothetical protein [Clostridium sp.]
MSKRRHKNKRDNTSENRRKQMQQQRQAQPQQQPQYNGPFGINPAQLLSMFGNIDMNQINNMLQNINRDGVDFNNFNLGMLQNLMGNGGGRTDNINNDNGENIINDEIDIFNDDLPKSNRNFQVDLNDENMQLLKSIRNIVSVERVPFVDKIIELYAKGAFKD